MSDRASTLTIEGEHAIVTLVQRLPYLLEAIWAAITDPAQRTIWFGETMMDCQVGGQIEMMPTEPPAPPKLKRVTGRIRVWDPPHMLTGPDRGFARSSGVSESVQESSHAN